MRKAVGLSGFSSSEREKDLCESAAKPPCRCTIANTNSDTGLTEAYIRDYRPDIGTNPDGTAHIGYNSHEVISGTNYNDWIDAEDGDDTIYGDGGDDVLDGKSGADHVYGGEGNDVIYGGDIDDFLDGGPGDDIIYAGSAAGATDVVIGGTGNDHLYGEAGIDEIHGDDGDDFIDAGGDTDIAFGDGGNDEMYGGDGPDELRGGLGDDIISGGSGPDLLLGQGGDDIIMGGIGGGAAQGDGDEVLGDVGFDIASFADSTIVLDVAADLNNQNLTTAPGSSPPFEPFGMLITNVEGLIGSKFADTLRGDGGDNWLIGGSGNDVQQGGAGNDLIVGDSIRLDVLAGRWHKSYDVAGNDVLNQDSQGLLDSQGFASHFTDLLTSRPNYVLGETNSTGTADKAVFTGNRADYDVTVLLYNTVTGMIAPNPGPNVITVYKIADHRPGAPDGTDLMMGVELFQFADRTVSLNLVTGTNGNNSSLNGTNGADLLLGLDGNDTLNGGNGSDIMVGGAGTDRYVFTASGSANGDAIIDFQAQSEVGAAHDIIDVSAIDANGNLPGNGTFIYGGETTAFSARGQLISYLDPGTGHYMLAGNTDGNNATAEFQIDLGSTHNTLAAADFVL
jgi:Ca2+-binding RTX toxin-like protein